MAALASRPSLRPVLLALALVPLGVLAPGVLGDRVLVGMPTAALSPWRGTISSDLAEAAADAALPIYADKTLQAWPMLVETWRQLAAGRPPLWNPDNLAGVPLLAQGFHAPFHPTTALLWGIGLPDGFVWLAWLQAAAAGVFMALLARELGAGRSGAFLAGLSYMLCGYLSARWHWYMIQGCSMWLPLALLGLERLVRGRGRGGTAAFTAAAVGCAFLTGWLQGAVHLVALGGVWVAVRLVGTWRSGGLVAARAAAGAGRAALAVALGLALAAVQIGPTVEYVAGGGSARRADVPPEVVRSLGLPLSGLLTVLIPDVFGHPVDLADHPVEALAGVGALRKAWARPNANAVESAATIGIASLLLALLGAAGRHRGRGLAVGCLLAGLILPLDTPILGWAARLPAISSGDPLRFLLLFAVGGSLLAGLGLTTLLERGPPAWLRVGAWCATAVAVLHVIGLAQVDVPAFGRFLAPHLARSAGVDVAAVEPVLPHLAFDLALLRDAFVRLTATLAACAAALSLASRWRVAGAALLVAVAVTDLGWTASRSATFAPADGALEPPPASPHLERTGGGRLLRHHPLGNSDLRAMPLPPNTGLPARLADAGGYWALAPRRVVEAWQALQPGEATSAGTAALSRVEDLGAPLLDRLAVTAVLSPERLDAVPGLELLGPWGDVWVHRRTTAWPRARLVYDWRLAGRDERLTLLAGATPAGDAGLTLLASETGTAPPPPSRPAGLPMEAVVPAIDEPGEVTCVVDAARDGLLVLADTWLPAWHATVDGEAVPVHVADHCLRAVEVPAGRHVVRFRYRSAGWSAGWPVSLAAAAVLAVLALRAAPRRRRR